MSNDAELQTVVVRLEAQVQQYQKEMGKAASRTEKQLARIEKAATQAANATNKAGRKTSKAVKDMGDQTARHARLMKQVEKNAARFTALAMTPMERYQQSINKLNEAFLHGLITQETYTRSVVRLRGELKKTELASKALADKNNAGLQRQLRLMKQVRRNAEMFNEKALTPLQRYRRSVDQLNEAYMHGLVNQDVYTRSLKRLRSELVKAQYDASGLGKALRVNGYYLRQLGREITFFATVPMALFGSASVREFAKFDKAMVRSVAIMEGVTSDMEGQMRRQAQALSSRSLTSQDDLAESYYFLASAGMDAERSMMSLETVMKFAEAGAFDMGRATSLLTDAQSALGLKVRDNIKNLENMKRVGDVLVRANTLADASTEQFAEALSNKAANSLRLVNKTVEEGVAILAVFADQGLKGSAAGERLAIVLRDLQRSAVKNKDMWKAMNVATFDGNGKMRKTSDVIRDLEDRMSNYTDEQKRATLSMLGFQDRSIMGIQSLLGFSNEIDRMHMKLNAASGTIEEVYQKQLKGFASQLTIAWNRVKVLGAQIGEALGPAVMSLIGTVEMVAQKFSSWNRSTQTLIVNAALVLAAIGPLTWIFGTLTTAIGTVIAIGSWLTVSITSTTAALWGESTAVAANSGIWATNNAVKGKSALFSLKNVGIMALVAVAAYKITRALHELVYGTYKDYNAALEKNIELNEKLVDKTQTRHQDTVSDLTRIQDPEKRWKAVDEEIAMEKKSLAGLEKMMKKKREVIDSYSTFAGVVGNKMLADEETALKEQKAQAKELEQHIKMMVTIRKDAEAQMEQQQKKPTFDGMFPEDFEEQFEKQKSVFETMQEDLLKSINTFGMTKRGVAQYELSVDGAGAAERRFIDQLMARKEAMEKAADIVKKSDDMLDGLADQIATFGMSSENAALFKLQMDGLADPARVRAIRMNIKALEDMRKQKEMMDEGAKLTDKYRSKNQKFMDDQLHLIDLWKANAISVGVFKKAMADLHKQFGADFVAKFKSEGVDAVKADSSAAAVAADNQLRTQSAQQAFRGLSKQYLRAALLKKGINPASLGLGAQANPRGRRNVPATPGSQFPGAGIASTDTYLKQIMINTKKDPIVIKESGLRNA